MSAEFEVITVTLSFVLGLGMTHLLWSAASAVRARRDFDLHWLPFVWAACIFAQHASFFVTVLDIDNAIGTWSWSWYLHVLLLGILLFGSGALVLPSESQQRIGSLLEDFHTHGRLGLLCLAAYQFAWFPTNYRLNGTLMHVGNLINLALVILALVGYGSRRPKLEAAAALGFAFLLAMGISFVWAFTQALPG